MMGNEKIGETNRPVTGWDKVHALALCVLAVVGIVIFVGPYVERLFVQGGGCGLGTQMSSTYANLAFSDVATTPALGIFRLVCARATPQSENAKVVFFGGERTFDRIELRRRSRRKD